MAVRIGKEKFESRILQAAKPVLVDFYSDSCIPCKMVSVTLGSIEEEYEEKLDVYKVNVNYEAELGGSYQVLAAPTLIAFYQGKELGRIRGAAKKEEILALFDGVWQS